jgi:hypothetical protein
MFPQNVVPDMEMILLGLVSKISDIREPISCAANSVIDQLIDSIDPAVVLSALCKCIDSSHIKTLIAALEIMNVVAKK